MAVLALTDCVVWLDSIDATGYTNAAQVEEQQELVDVSVYGSAWRQKIATARMASMSHQGFWSITEEATLDTNLTATQVVSFGQASTAGSVAYSMSAKSGQLTRGGTYAGVAELAGTYESSGPVGRGVISLAKQSITGAVNGTSVQFSGGIAAGYAVAMAIHVFSAGTTADFILESDDNSGFTTATTKASSTITAAGGTWSAVSGALTDDYYRIRTANVTGTFSAAATVVTYKL